MSELRDRLLALAAGLEFEAELAGRHAIERIALGRDEWAIVAWATSAARFAGRALDVREAAHR